MTRRQTREKRQMVSSTVRMTPEMMLDITTIAEKEERTLNMTMLRLMRVGLAHTLPNSTATPLELENDL